MHVCVCVSVWGGGVERKNGGVARQSASAGERQMESELDGESSTLTEQPGSIEDKWRGMHSE